MRSRLDFNMSKTVSQPLNCGDKLIITYDNNETTEIEPKKFDTDKQEEGTNQIIQKIIPVHINSNYTCQAALDTIKIKTDAEDSLDLKLKISKQETPQLEAMGDLPLNNYINGGAKYTKFNFDNLASEVDEQRYAFTLNVNQGNSLYR